MYCFLGIEFIFTNSGIHAKSLKILIKNYLVIAFRSLLKNKVYSIINIMGLAIGLACFIFISLYILDEVSYDRFYPNAERIFRINADIRFGGTDLNLALSSDPLGPTLKKDYPQVEQYVRLYTMEGAKQIKNGSAFVTENNVCYADSTFFEVFKLPVLYGNASTALSSPKSIAISEKAALKYFKTSDATGKILTIGSSEPVAYKVTAVYQDIPANSHFKKDFLLPMSDLRFTPGNYLANNFHTYILLKEQVDYKLFERNFEGLILKYILPQINHFIGINTMANFKKAGNRYEYSLIPLTDIHLKSDRADELDVNGNIQYVYIFSVVALFILIIACINFINLTTARSANRSKEVGIKKTLGSERSSLIMQFITESTVTSCFAFVIALLIVIVLIPVFNDITTKSFSVGGLFGSGILFYLLLLPILVGVAAGYYPAIFLSSFQPITAMKSKFGGGYTRSNLRDILVTFQFVTSLILICGTMIVYQQLNYIQTKNLGFSKDQVLVVNGTDALGNSTEVFKRQVAGIAGVKSASNAGFLPVGNSSGAGHIFSKDPVMDEKNGTVMQFWRVDYDYIKTMDIKLQQGRDFSVASGAADFNKVIINESTARILGYDNPVGKKIYSYDGGAHVEDIVPYEIVGVVRNFHFESLRHSVGPLCMILGHSNWKLAFRIDGKDAPALLGQIEAKWKALTPEIPFSYNFLDDSFDQMYRSEQRVGKIALIFAALTMFIACLGLFGLVTYISEQRTKEIGVRKVLGASTFSIVRLLSNDLLRLVLLSILIAFPLAYYFMQKWLQDFAYGVSISWWVFAWAGVGALLVAFGTVGYRAISAALTNPVTSLRSE